MNANPILLQIKYARLVKLFSSECKIDWEEALGFFYHSEVYTLMRDGISDMHCRSDKYLCEDLINEWNKYVERKESNDRDS